MSCNVKLVLTREKLMNDTFLLICKYWSFRIYIIREWSFITGRGGWEMSARVPRTTSTPLALPAEKFENFENFNRPSGFGKVCSTPL